MLSLAAQVQWGDVATWASVGTVLAFFAAILSVWLQRRDINLRARQAFRAQASGVSVEVESRPDVNSSGEKTWRITVRNASSSPIFGCDGNVWMPGMKDPGSGAGSRLTIGTVPAGTERTVHVVTEPDAH